MQLTITGATAWLAESIVTSTSGHGLWLHALDGVALDLVQRAVQHLVQGKDGMGPDVQRKAVGGSYILGGVGK